jgi:hypothetical protein
VGAVVSDHSVLLVLFQQLVLQWEDVQSLVYQADAQ